MKIMVTGGTGFLGSALIEWIRACDRLHELRPAGKAGPISLSCSAHRPGRFDLAPDPVLPRLARADQHFSQWRHS